jgi:hypothetical protein
LRDESFSGASLFAAYSVVPDANWDATTGGEFPSSEAYSYKTVSTFGVWHAKL